MAAHGLAEVETPVFALEEYDPAPSVELLCAICRMVLTNPEECPCRHVFCSRCIREWLGKVQPPTCPMCRVEIETTTLVPVLPLVRSLLDRLTVKCRNAGCGARAEVGSYSAHAKECEYENEVCRHTGCKHECTRKEMEAHVDQCPFRKLPCIKNCGLEVTSVDQGKHSCRKELMEKLQGETAKRESSERQVETLEHKKRRLMDVLLQIGDALQNLKTMMQDLDAQVTLAIQENAGDGEGAQAVA